MLKRHVKKFVLENLSNTDFDPDTFRDDCYAYAKLLQTYHVSVRFTCIPGQIHEYGGCNRWRLALSEAEDPIVQIISAIHAARLE